jgi:hypothetical protein
MPSVTSPHPRSAELQRVVRCMLHCNKSPEHPPCYCGQSIGSLVAFMNTSVIFAVRKLLVVLQHGVVRLVCRAVRAAIPSSTAPGAVGGLAWS